MILFGEAITILRLKFTRENSYSIDALKIYSIMVPFIYSTYWNGLSGDDGLPILFWTRIGDSI